MPRFRIYLLVLSLLFLGLAYPAPLGAQGIQNKGMLPGQAAPVPLPPPSVMATTQGSPSPASPFPAAPGGAAAAAGADPLTSLFPKADTLTLADLRGKLTATRDFMWESQDKLMMMDYLDKLQEQQRQVENARK